MAAVLVIVSEEELVSFDICTSCGVRHVVRSHIRKKLTPYYAVVANLSRALLIPSRNGRRNSRSENTLI